MIISLPFPDRDRHYHLRPSKIIALGLNYQDHVEETGRETPEEPVLFSKTPNVLIGDGEDIIIPGFLYEAGYEEVTVHYEAELAFVIGRTAKNVPKEDAMDYVLGFTCFNDVSQRNLQFSDMSGWFRGKSLDTFGPIGPRLVTPSQLPDPHGLAITCKLNGRTVQQSNTGNMIFDIPSVIAYISKQITLEEGDVVATGTPSGVGRMTDGDEVEVEIEGIGILRNRVVEPCGSEKAKEE